ncbi:flavin reductase [Clostridiaceae bacterium DONG20-135]|uniref:Flavin reductase n=1 Tax=Copranaerobaculum intestinale TaxID=2692629 RepID=A0A6N8U983_9FIRM|nr:flavin reductase [Copranaerobaculum intestinale]MXQ74015.1 flavin reductase [Copranaerobaculum intestinale]
MDLKAFFKLSYGLYVISSSVGDHKAGCVANTLNQVTNDPARMSVTLNKDNDTMQTIAKSGRFAAIVLSESTNMELIKTFGFQSSKDTDKFSGYDTKMDELGSPYITDHATARFTCKVVNQIDLGTHVMFIGEVESAEVLSEEPVMTYAYYHQVKNGATPKNAPSYQKETKKVGWRCTICGYIYDGDPLPEDYICPLCGAPASAFEKLS